MMHNGNEWYWNLNLHRNQSVLNNSMAVNSKKLPTPSTLYTSAVLTDRGICVGMRNVNLKDANHSYSSKNQNIPNCCSNLNIVGQRNGEIWTAAFDQMRYSALTDPSMATQVDPQFKCPSNNTKWIEEDEDQVISPCDKYGHESVSSVFNPESSISAEFNPFHLFGDKSVLSSISLKNGSKHGLSQSLAIPNISEKMDNKMLTMPTLNHFPYFNYNYITKCDTNCNCVPFNCYSSYCQPTSKSMSVSFRSNSSSHLPCSMLKVAVKSPHRKTDTNASRSSHVVAPKKKWIQNYMQSNSHLCFL